MLCPRFVSAFRVVLVLSLLSLSFARYSAAQRACIQSPPKNSCFAHFTFWVGDTYLPYGAACLCGDGVPRMYSDCYVATDQCSGICIDCALYGGQPINLSSGNTFITQTDVSLPGLGGGIALTRTWNSITQGSATAGRMFGWGWTSTYEERIFTDDDDGLVKYSRGNGDLWSFGVTTLYVNGGTQTLYSLVAPRNAGATLVSDGTYLTLTFKSGETRIFNLAGRLVSIGDRNGNITQLTYDGSSRLTTVTDAASRHLYFTYTPYGGENLVTSVTSDFGVSLAYSYDGWYLSRVTKPDSTFITFDRTFQSGFLTSLTVKDQDGKVLASHTFELNGRGSSSQRANGVEAMSVTYVQ
jgi:YD repeat-containing protein